MTISGDNKYDAIVVGTGLGGLSAALHLAKRGLHVLALEKQPKVGGYCQNFMRGDYNFDVSQHIIPALREGQGFRSLLDYIQVLDKLEYYERDPMFTSEYPDKTYELPGGGTEPVRNYLKSAFPEDSDGVDRYLELANRIVDDNFNLFWTGDLDLEKHFPTKFFGKTYKELLDGCTTNEKLHGLLGQFWQSTGLPNDRLAANWGVEVIGIHLLTGNFYIKGGGQRLSQVMAETLRESGGVVRTASLVSKILVEERRAYGVELENGERFTAPIIASNANPVQTYLSLIGKEKLSKPIIYRLETLEPSCSLLTMYMGLDCPASEAGIDAHTFFMNYTYDNAMSYRLSMAEEYDRTDYVISNYTDDSGNHHPTGMGIVQMAEAADGKPWIDIPHEQYVEKKARVVETMLTKASKRFPKLRDHIKVCELGTPRTLHAVTRNPWGSVYGWAQTPGQADLTRFGAKSLFEGLYFAGAWCRGGGGGYMGSIINGRVAAREILAKEGIENAEIHIPVQHQKEAPAVSEEQNTVTLGPDDIDSNNEIRRDRTVAILEDAAKKHVRQNRALIDKEWPDLQLGDELSVSMFHMRLLFVPSQTNSVGDRVSVQTTMQLKERGKAEVVQELTTGPKKTKLARSNALVLIG